MKYLAILTAVLLCLAACTKDIVIPELPYDGKTSIQCLITPGELPTVYTYQAVRYFDPKITPRQLFLPKASVHMTGAGDTIAFTIDSVTDVRTCEQLFFWKGDKPIRPDATYTLTVTNGEQVFSAQATTNQSLVQLDSVKYVSKFTDVFGGHEGIVLFFRDRPGAENFYRFQLNGFIQDTVIDQEGGFGACSIGQTNRVHELGRTIYTDQNLDGEPFSFVTEPTFQHKKGQEAYVRLQSVDKNIYTFYDNLDHTKIAQYNPFVEPVFLQIGQFGEKGVGVFGAYAVSDSVRFVYPE